MTANRSRSGRITPLFAFIMTALSVFFGLSLNFSRLLQQRAHLQTCADAAAFSGAVQQARGLNRIARMNTQAAETLRLTATALKCWTFPDHESGRVAAARLERGYRIYNTVNLVRQQQYNMKAAKEARRTAEQVTALNEPEAQMKAYVPLAWGMGRLIPWKGTSMRFGFFFWQETPYGPVLLYDPGKEVKAYVFKKALERDTIYFTARVRQPSFTWLFDRGLRNDVRNLRAYATAKPAGGSLWKGSEGDPEYRVKLVRTGSVFLQPDIPDSWGYQW